MLVSAFRSCVLLFLNVVLIHPDPSPPLRLRLRPAIVRRIADAIAREEGWGVRGSLPTRLNNPGALVYTGQHGTKPFRLNARMVFARFPTPAAGRAEMEHCLNRMIDKGLTLEQITYRWAPPFQNNTKRYLRHLTLAAHVGPRERLDTK